MLTQTILNMKIAFFLLTAYFFATISLEPFQITEDARKFLDKHNITYAKKKNNVWESTFQESTPALLKKVSQFSEPKKH